MYKHHHAFGEVALYKRKCSFRNAWGKVSGFSYMGDKVWSIKLKSIMTQMTKSWGVLLRPLVCMEAQTAEGYHVGHQQGCFKRSSKSFK